MEDIKKIKEFVLVYTFQMRGHKQPPPGGKYKYVFPHSQFCVRVKDGVYVLGVVLLNFVTLSLNWDIAKNAHYCFDKQR